MRSVFGYFGLEEIHEKSTHYYNDEFVHFYSVSNLKFEDDKIYLNNDEYIIILDGVILNKLELLEAEPKLNWTSFFLLEWEKSPKGCLNKLRGEFSGFVYNKRTKALNIFNNPTGTKQIFCYHNKNQFAFASCALDLIRLVKRLNWDHDVNKDACYSFLAYGALIKDTSWLTNSFRLRAGSILSITDGKTDVIPYKVFEISENHQKSKKELLEKFDKLITRAVKLEWDKDKEYDYKSFSTLSGGLDSRVNVMLARELGYTDQINFCCSKKGYADETISREMAKDFGHQYHFHALDGLEHFYEANYMTSKIGGANVYMGPAHLRYGIDQYWDKDCGIIHSGQLGDAFLGGFITEKTSIKPNLKFGRESYDVLPALKYFENDLTSTYPNEEIFKMYERGYLVTNSGFWILEDLSYYTSPFLDIDLLDFLSELPYKYKYKRTFYLEWMNTYHPEMTKYNWEYVHSKPNAIWKTKYATTFMRIKYGWRKLISPEFRLKFDMSPEQYWYNTSTKLQAYYKNMLEEKLETLNDFIFPYKDELIKFTQSNNVGQLSKALSMLLVLEEIYKEDA